MPDFWMFIAFASRIFAAEKDAGRRWRSMIFNKNVGSEG
jgi:hypothetical protein